MTECPGAVDDDADDVVADDDDVAGVGCWCWVLVMLLVLVMHDLVMTIIRVVMALILIAIVMTRKVAAEKTMGRQLCHVRVLCSPQSQSAPREPLVWLFIRA